MLIRTKFYAVVILSILLGVSGTSFVNYVIFKRELQNTLHDRESVVLQKIVNETRGKLDSLYQTVNFIRVNPSTAGFIEEGAHGDDYPQMISTLHSVQAILPTDSSIAVSDASGKILMSSNNISLYQGNIADKGYFASAMDGHLVAAFEPLPGDPSKYNAVISSPVRTPDGITGTVTAFLPADELLNQKFLDTLGYRNENTFFIADKSGNVILERGNSSSGLRYRHDLVYAASAENLSGMLRDGGHMIFFSFLPRTGAFIVSYSPMSYLYRPLHLFRDSNIFMHLVIVCTVAVCAKILLMSVLPRLKQGMDFARTVVSGDISGSLETSGDELGVMFGAFNTMISHLRTALTKAEVMERRAVSANDALAAHNARLEALVTERTKDLEKAHEHTCLMLNMTNEAIIELDGDKNMIFANLSTAKMLGYDEDELKGKDFFSSIRHCHAEGVLCGSDDCGFRRAVSGGEETRLHNIFITNRSGHFIPVSVSVLPEGPQNSGGGTIIAIMDLSAINMKFQEIHDSSPTAIITVRDGMVWKINDNGFAMFGLRPGDRIGKIYADPEQLGAMRSALSRGLQVRDYPAQLYDVNGNRIDALVALHLFIHEGIESTIMWVSDVTALTQAKIMAEKAARARTVFLASMSHEIRTPLNAIMGISEAELQSGLSGETRVSFEKIYSSGSTLLGIINDILDMSKINSGKFEIVPAEYDFTSMMSDTIQQNIVRIASKPIKFESSIDENTPARLFGDEIRIRQILNNLLSNAFKYTNEGTVSLDVT
ncbi:MAG: PAS domain S-box protein, partial [Synergistaceae bacterium]|nr:PAS domain S-box protein [Synergistaceae bacterium]